MAATHEPPPDIRWLQANRLAARGLLDEATALAGAEWREHYEGLRALNLEPLDPLDPTGGWRARSIPLDVDPLVPEVAGLFIPGILHELTGESESGKTMLLLAAAVDECRKGRAVVWCDFEMGPRQMARRLLDGLQLEPDEIRTIANDPDTRLLHYLAPGMPALAEHVRELADLHPSLVVIDAMTGVLELHGQDSNSDVAIALVHRLIAIPFKDTGAAVVLIDHPGKDPERGTRGSSRKGQGVDVQYVVKASKRYAKDRGGQSRLIVKRDRTAELDRELVRTFDLGVLEWSFSCIQRPVNERTATGGFRPTHLMESVSRWLEENPEGGSKRVVCREVKGDKDSAKWAAIQALVAEGYAEQTTQGRAHIVRSVKAFREHDDDDAAHAARMLPHAAQAAPPDPPSAHAAHAAPPRRGQHRSAGSMGTDTAAPEYSAHAAHTANPYVELCNTCGDPITECRCLE